MARAAGNDQPSLAGAHLRAWWLVAGMVAVVVTVAFGLVVGPVRIGVGAVARELLGLASGLSDQEQAIVVDIRLPRVVLGLLVGATLSLAGASYQGVFRNPLADPYLLGAASGAGLGGTIAVVATAATDTTDIPCRPPSPPSWAPCWPWPRVWRRPSTPTWRIG